MRASKHWQDASGTRQPQDASAPPLDVVLDGDARRRFDFVVMAVPWHRLRGLLPAALLAWMPELAVIHRFEPVPITAVHLWFDRPITPLPHAVLPGRTSQWLFRIVDPGRAAADEPHSAAGLAPRCSALPSGEGEVKGRTGETPVAPSNRTGETPVAPSKQATPGTAGQASSGTPSHSLFTYQVLISAAHEESTMPRAQLVERVVGELRSLGEAARDARLIHWRVSPQPHAVFSPQAGLDEHRPGPDTAVDNLLLAGDWTATGWPATLEGAVRGGRIAAERILQHLGRHERLLTADLPRGWLARWVVGE